MPRVKGGVNRTKRRRNILKRTKGFEAGRKNLIRLAKTAETKAGAHALRDRRRKKAQIRTLWQTRINAAIRPYEMSYSKFIGALKSKKNQLDRKVLSAIANEYPEVFAKIVASVK